MTPVSASIRCVLAMARRGLGTVLIGAMTGSTIVDRARWGSPLAGSGREFGDATTMRFVMGPGCSEFSRSCRFMSRTVRRPDQDRFLSIRERSTCGHSGHSGLHAIPRQKEVFHWQSGNAKHSQMPERLVIEGQCWCWGFSGTYHRKRSYRETESTLHCRVRSGSKRNELVAWYRHHFVY